MDVDFIEFDQQTNMFLSCMGSALNYTYFHIRSHGSILVIIRPTLCG